MRKDKYPQYGLIAAAGFGLAVWAGLPVATLLFLLVCPLMMFFMMRGMHGAGHARGTDPIAHDQRTSSSSEAEAAAMVSGARRHDGSHESINLP